MSEPKDPRELLTMLSSKVQQFLTLGGDPFYTPSEIAYMISKIENPNAITYAYVKYAGQLELAEKLSREIRIEFLSTNDLIRKWQVPRPNWILDMARLAVGEDINPSKCPACKGVKSRLIKGKIVICPHCGGGGSVCLSDSDRARLLDIDKSNWSRTWRHRYDLMRSQTIWAWDKELEYVMREQRNAHHAMAS